MKKIIYFYHYFLKISMKKIKVQILFSMIILTLFITTAISMVNYQISKKKMEDNYKKTYENNLDAFGDVIDMKLYGIIDLLRTSILEEKVMQVLKDKNKSGTKYYSSSSSLSLDNLFLNLESQTNLLDGLFIIDNEGRYYRRLKAYQNASGYNQYYYQNNAEDMLWMKDAKPKKGKEIFYGYDVMNPQSGRDVVSFAKDIIDPTTLQSVGFVVVNLNKSFLSSSLLKNGGNFKTDTLFVIDTDAPNPVVYHTGDKAYASDIITQYLNSGNDSTSKYLYTSRLNKITGWEIVNGIAKDDLSRDSSYVGTMILISSVSLAVICFFISGFLTKKINRPLRKLELVIHQLKDGSRHITEDFDDNEIGKIGSLLKETVNNNLELKEQLLSLKLKEREAELLLLQAQINPHFLYNTLDSIYCMALIGKEKPIADMVSALSDTFKISLNNGKQVISIREEIHYIERYMTIQNIRYEQRFDLILEIDEDVLDLCIIKFILQPFVENSMYHGLEPKLGKGYIEIKGECTDNNIYFTISDNGVGMKDSSDIEKGFGVTNVIDRIHLFYGPEYGILVQSEYSVGTKVQIHIPVIEKGDDYEHISSN